MFVPIFDKAACMANPRRTSQQKILEIDRGLFVLRYSATDNDPSPPTVTVTPDDTGIDVRFVLHPDREEAVLWKPGTALVVQAERQAQLRVEVKATDANGFSSATVRLEELTQGTPGKEIEIKSWDDWDQTSLPEQVGGKLRVIGHVAGVGDVSVQADEWIAGPKAPSRIEGIVLHWANKPAGLTVRYAVKFERATAAESAPVELGTFAGSRGRAMPLVGIMLELSGPQAARFEVTAEALFLGAPVSRANGQRVVLKGSTGREPLVGLRINVNELKDVKSSQSTRPSEEPKPRGRVRVFRSPGAKSS
jgi:hypothetical protein